MTVFVSVIFEVLYSVVLIVVVYPPEESAEVAMAPSVETTPLSDDCGGAAEVTEESVVGPLDCGDVAGGDEDITAGPDDCVGAAYGAEETAAGPNVELADGAAVNEISTRVSVIVLAWVGRIVTVAGLLASTTLMPNGIAPHGQYVEESET